MKDKNIFDSEYEKQKKEDLKNIKNISADSGYLHDWNNQRNKKRSLLLKRLGVFAIAAAVVIAATSYIGYQNLQKTRAEVEEFMANMTPAPTQVAEKATPEPIEYSDEFSQALAMNKYVIGYLKINDTEIDFPIVQGEDDNFFENRNYDKSYSEVAATYMLADCDPEVTRHLIIYGENVDLEGRFFELNSFLEYDFFNTHEYIVFEMEDGAQLWQVFSVHLGNSTFDYKDIEFENNIEYIAYIRMFQTMSRFERNIELTEKDQILTLVTDYHDLDLEEGYLMVHARRVN